MVLTVKRISFSEWLDFRPWIRWVYLILLWSLDPRWCRMRMWAFTFFFGHKTRKTFLHHMRWFCFSTLVIGWKNLAPFSQPISSKSTINHDLITCVLSRFAGWRRAASTRFEVWLACCIVWVVFSDYFMFVVFLFSIVFLLLPYFSDW